MDEAQVMEFAREFRAAGEEKIYGSGGLIQFDDYAEWLDDISVTPPGRVEQSVYLSWDDKTLVGCVTIREKLNAQLSLTAGNIGYSVRPSLRRKGYGKAQLRLALDECARAGLTHALVTCDEDNVASVGVIRSLDGLEDMPYAADGEVIRRFWISTAATDYAKVNSETWDRWVDGGIPWGIPISHEDFLRAAEGDIKVHLASVRHVPRQWFPPLSGAKVLCLAGGGGQQAPVFAAHGARCTVFDNSARQLAGEELVARREGYEIELIKGDMTKRLPFEDGQFDMVFHPVSNCYVENVYHVWRECSRVLKKGGVLLAGMDNGIGFLFGDYDDLTVRNVLPYNPLRNPELLTDPNGGIQFSHTLEEQLGGQLRAGFAITDIMDDYDDPGAALGRHTPLYIMTRAVKL
jgi:predicted acetyltransferase/2-polyprenyl-3-methyl-5-hydroxy-6-metoxy-1,4-benzoquinol methylase